MKTWNPKPNEVKRSWWIVDAKGKTLGRLATHIATVLRGKNKPEFTPHVDTGDFIVVINSDQIELTGNKWTEKTYYRHSRYFGSLKEMSAEQHREKDSTFIISEAVRGMLPKNKLARQILKKLKIYPGSEHPHNEQRPETLSAQ